MGHRSDDCLHGVRVTRRMPAAVEVLRKPLDPRCTAGKAGRRGAYEANMGCDYTAEEFDVLKAVADFKRVRRRQYPTVCELLAVLKSRGWRRVESPGPMPEAQGAPCRGKNALGHHEE
jgi:hypothetical protein